MKVKLTGPKTLNLQSNQVAYILDCLARRPYNEVRELIDHIFSQLRQQENSHEEISAGGQLAAPDYGM